MYVDILHTTQRSDLSLLHASKLTTCASWYLPDDCQCQLTTGRRPVRRLSSSNAVTLLDVRFQELAQVNHSLLLDRVSGTTYFLRESELTVLE